MRRFLGFASRVTAIHVLTYLVIGAISYWLIAQKYWTGPQALPGLRDPNGEFVQRWFLPAQFLRGLLHAVALFPLRGALLALGGWGGLVIASLLLVIGSLAGISGLIENLVYTTSMDWGLFLAHLPEVVLQTLLFGYVLLWWERRVEARRARA